MAALQATSIAKAGNRYAPGGVSSASYFGGLSTHQLSRPEASASTELNNNAFPSAALQPGQQGPHTVNLVPLAAVFGPSLTASSLCRRP